MTSLTPTSQSLLRRMRSMLALRATLESKGEMIGNNDVWIAAHALATGLILVTNNEEEFRRVPGLKIQNWVG